MSEGKALMVRSVFVSLKKMHLKGCGCLVCNLVPLCSVHLGLKDINE